MKYLTRRYSNNNRDLWRDFENFFNSTPFYNSSYPQYKSNGTFRPAVDLFEDESNYFVRAEIPGFKKKELEVNLERDRLMLKGERKNKGEGEKSTLSFHRSVNLPSTIESKRIEAHYENGMLTVTIPKAESAKPRKIEINS
ncbi:Hsp20/alpha crystallin family protein [Opitutia bacterium ISCC 51]|nr:Hsp20/alpha crystallin family protein [Opitutae bacterium ISCC 51]QXD28087.1 Hsp20/alpha crystallin family protein [Opitutae bacterium ISCC 52]